MASYHLSIPPASLFPKFSKVVLGNKLTFRIRSQIWNCSRIFVVLIWYQDFSAKEVLTYEEHALVKQRCHEMETQLGLLEELAKERERGTQISQEVCFGCWTFQMFCFNRKNSWRDDRGSTNARMCAAVRESDEKSNHNTHAPNYFRVWNRL